MRSRYLDLSRVPCVHEVTLATSDGANSHMMICSAQYASERVMNKAPCTTSQAKIQLAFTKGDTRWRGVAFAKQASALYSLWRTRRVLAGYKYLDDGGSRGSSVAVGGDQTAFDKMQHCDLYSSITYGRKEQHAHSWARAWTTRRTRYHHIMDKLSIYQSMVRHSWTRVERQDQKAIVR